METKSINIYTFEELSDKAKEKALNDFRSKNDFAFLSEDLMFNLEEKLLENKIESFKVKHYFSLSYCQGDGYVFIGNFKFKGYNVDVIYKGRYYHFNSKELRAYDNEVNEAPEEIYKEFEELFIKICKEMETLGYEIIEAENNKNYIIERFKETECYFLQNGTLEEVRN